MEHEKVNLGARVMRGSEHHSKTFVFATMKQWADFLVELDETITCVRAPIENTVRVTIIGERIYEVDELATKHSASPAEGEKGEWLPIFR